MYNYTGYIYVIYKFYNIAYSNRIYIINKHIFNWLHKITVYIVNECFVEYKTNVINIVVYTTELNNTFL